MKKPVPLRSTRRMRTCLRCGESFDSFGPQNRRCSECTRGFLRDAEIIGHEWLAPGLGHRRNGHAMRGDER